MPCTKGLISVLLKMDLTHHCRSKPPPRQATQPIRPDPSSYWQDFPAFIATRKSTLTDGSWWFECWALRFLMVGKVEFGILDEFESVARGSRKRKLVGSARCRRRDLLQQTDSGPCAYRLSALSQLFVPPTLSRNRKEIPYTVPGTCLFGREWSLISQVEMGT